MCTKLHLKQTLYTCSKLHPKHTFCTKLHPKEAKTMQKHAGFLWHHGINYKVPLVRPSVHVGIRAPPLERKHENDLLPMTTAWKIPSAVSDFCLIYGHRISGDRNRYERRWFMHVYFCDGVCIFVCGLHCTSLIFACGLNKKKCVDISFSYFAATVLQVIYLVGMREFAW